MINILYKVNKNIIGREAAQLNWKLNSLSTSINIINQENRKVNGKSLIGLLSGNFKKNQNITIIIDTDKEIDKIKQYFNEIGKEIK